MKPIRHLIILALTLITTLAGAQTNTPGEQLTQMVGQLQKTPTNSALREKIIKLGQEMKPALAIPDKAIEFEGRAKFAFKSAKSETAFLAAAQEYENAITAAPWVLEYYFNLYVTYEKAGIYVEAKRNCEFYLIGQSDPDQIMDAKRRIAGLNFAIEQFSEVSLSKKDQPFRTDIPELSAGQRWFGGGYYSKGEGKRHESWIVSDRTTATSLSIDWFDAQQLAKYVLHPGGVLGANREPIQKNPDVEVRPLKRDDAAPNIFYEEWGLGGKFLKGATYEFSADGETVYYTSLGKKNSWRRIQ